MGLDAETREEVQRIAEQTALRAARDVVAHAPTTGLLTQPAWVPGTVDGMTQPGADASVRMDGETSSLPGGVQNATGTTLADGARVIVLFRPTGGALVVGFAGPALGWQYLERRVLTAASGVTFAAPAGYRDLRFIVRARSANQAGDQGLNIALNGDTTAANYFRQIMWSVGGVATPGSVASRTIANITGTAGGTDRRGYMETTLFDYLETTNDKHLMGINYTQGGTGIVGTTGMVWFQGSSLNAVTSVAFTPIAGTMTGTATMIGLPLL